MSQLGDAPKDSLRGVLSNHFVYRPTGRAPRPSWLSPEITRYIPAIGCIVIPFLILFLYQHTVGELKRPIQINPIEIISSDCPVPESEKASERQNRFVAEVRKSDREGADVYGRFALTITSAVLRILAIVGMCFAVFVILRRTSPIAGTVTSIASFGLGFVLFERLTREEGTRKTLVIPIMEAVRQANPNLLGQGQEDIVIGIVNVNSWFGFTAVVSILCALGVVAIRAQDQELTPAILRQRLFDFRWLMIVAAAILVLTVVITRTLVDWQLSYLCESYRDGLKVVGSALANYWGIGSSSVLLGALIPSYFSWSRDVAKWAQLTKKNKPEKERYLLIEGEALNFSPTSSVSTILTVAVPALSGPAFELLKIIPGVSGH